MSIKETTGRPRPGSSVVPDAGPGREEGPVEQGGKRNGHGRDLLKAVILALALAGGFAVIRFSPLASYLNLSRIGLLQDRLTAMHGWAAVVFVGAGALLIAMGAPRSFHSILGGMVFGFFEGTALALAAALAGSVVIFWATRRLGRPLFRQKVGPYLKAIEGHMEREGFLTVVLLRQLPLTCMLVNVLIGLTAVSSRAFFLGSLVGLLPETAIFSLFGSSVREGFVLRISAASALLVLLVIFVRICMRRSSLARKLSEN